MPPDNFQDFFLEPPKVTAGVYSDDPPGIALRNSVKNPFKNFSSIISGKTSEKIPGRISEKNLAGIFEDISDGTEKSFFLNTNLVWIKEGIFEASTLKILIRTLGRIFERISVAFLE